MQIPTVVLMQSQFTNGIWAGDSIQAIGLGGYRATAGVDIPIDPDPKPPHYMKGVRRMGFGRYAAAMAGRALNVGVKNADAQAVMA